MADKNVKANDDNAADDEVTVDKQDAVDPTAQETDGSTSDEQREESSGSAPADEPALVEYQEPQVGGTGAENENAGAEGSDLNTGPVTMAEATAGDSNVTSHGTAASETVRLSDVLAHIENFFARHATLPRELATDLKSGLTTLERL
jgi:hypothetical protein